MLVMAVSSRWLGRGWHARRPGGQHCDRSGRQARIRSRSSGWRAHGWPRLEPTGRLQGTRPVVGGVRLSPRPPPEDHHRPSYVVRTREGKVVVPDVEIRRGSLRLVPIYPADPRPVYQQLADSLRARILSGELPPGSLLPSESEII